MHEARKVEIEYMCVHITIRLRVCAHLYVYVHTYTCTVYAHPNLYVIYDEFVTK